MIGALLGSSCCIVPLGLVALGVSGAWIGALTAMEPYKPYILAATFGLLGAGFWRVYVKPPRQCDIRSPARVLPASRVTKIALPAAATLALLAATTNLWGPLLY